MTDDVGKPACRHLRAKAMYGAGDPPRLETPGRPEEPMDIAYVWCNCTLTVVGPDNVPVSLEDCTASRRCFDPAEGRSLEASAS